MKTMWVPAHVGVQIAVEDRKKDGLLTGVHADGTQVNLSEPIPAGAEVPVRFHTYLSRQPVELRGRAEEGGTTLRVEKMDDSARRWIDDYVKGYQQSRRVVMVDDDPVVLL